jgi:hypothetical protein
MLQFVRQNGSHNYVTKWSFTIGHSISALCPSTVLGFCYREVGALAFEVVSVVTVIVLEWYFFSNMNDEVDPRWWGRRSVSHHHCFLESTAERPHARGGGCLHIPSFLIQTILTSQVQKTSRVQ